MRIQEFIDEATQHYAVTALWSSIDFGPGDDEEFEPVPMDYEHSTDDLALETEERFGQDVTDFVSSNWRDVKDLDPGQVGHDFWLTRNRHGAGFWDRGLGERGDRLTRAADAYGTCDLYVGDDGQIWAE